MKTNQTKLMSIKVLKAFENNPRNITDDAFLALCKSLKDDPEYFKARPIIASDRTGELVIIGGNQRYKAANKIGLKKVPVTVISGMTEEEEVRILMKDNSDNFGTMDFSVVEIMGWQDIVKDPSVGINHPFIEKMPMDGKDVSGSSANIERSFKVYFLSAEEESLFTEFLLKLRDKYPNEPVVSKRILAYCAAIQKENEEIDDSRRFLTLIKTEFEEL